MMRKEEKLKNITTKKEKNYNLEDGGKEQLRKKGRGLDVYEIQRKVTVFLRMFKRVVWLIHMYPQHQFSD